MVVFSTVAQTDKGNFLFAGNAGFNFSNTKSNLNNDALRQSINSVNINPSVSYFVLKNFHVGVLANYLSQNEEFITTNNDMPLNVSSSTMLIGPQIGYIFNSKGIARFFLGAGYGYARQTEKDPFFNPFFLEDIDETQVYTGNFVAASAGVALFFNKNVSFNLGLQSNVISLKNNQKNPVTGNSSGGIIFGFAVFL